MKFSTSIKRKLFIVALAIGLPFAGYADSPLVSTMQAYLVTQDADGNEVLKPAEKARPKDVIEYRLSYSNVSAEPISGLAITGPVPESTVYIADTAATMERSNFKVSIDDGETWEDEPVLRTRKNDRGEMQQVVVSPSEYTHIRWYAATPLLANAEQQYRYRVQIQ